MSITACSAPPEEMEPMNQGRVRTGPDERVAPHSNPGSVLRSRHHLALLVIVAVAVAYVMSMRDLMPAPAREPQPTPTPTARGAEPFAIPANRT
jgi:hypothetical protein